MRPLIVDLTYASDLALGAGRGVAAAAVDQQLARHAALPPWPGAEPPAWFDLPLDEAPARAVMAWADSLPPTDDVVLVGIGGSALTARVVAALRTPEAPRLHVLDTVDPVAVQALTTRLDPARSVLVGISKSGTTLETTAVFLVIEAWLEKALGAAAPARIAVVVGSQPNPLRARASERGYACFDIPVGVGGRFSALTAAGLLPARLVGVDPLALLRGAAALRARCAGSDVRSHPALALAAHHAAAEAAGRCVAVVWPYGEALNPLGPWWSQLVGESLGKPTDSGPAGVTPLAARGPADQHSLLQLLVAGPDDKLVVFVEAVGPAGPAVPEDEHALCLASGQALGRILQAEQEATEHALAVAGRPSITVRLPAADAESVGAFLFLWETAVVLWARLLGVDPYDQPGVQQGKDAARARLTGAPTDLAARLDAHRAQARRTSE